MIHIIRLDKKYNPSLKKTCIRTTISKPNKHSSSKKKNTPQTKSSVTATQITPT